MDVPWREVGGLSFCREIRLNVDDPFDPNISSREHSGRFSYNISKHQQKNV